MKSFFLKCALFSLPIALVYGAAFSVLVISRELVTMDAVIAVQERHPEALVNFGYGNYTKYYKTRMSQRIDPEIIAIGSSRAMEFRSGFFSNDATFYNAAGMDNASDFVSFIRAIPNDARLKTIIVGVDARYLQREPARSAPILVDPMKEQQRKFFSHTAKNVYTDYVQDKYTLTGLLEQRRTTQNIGMIALASKKGFRADGSYDYGMIPNDAERIATLNDLIEERMSSIQKGGFGIGYDDEISRKHLEDIKAFLEECRSRNITVIGFLPPSPEPLQNLMRSLTDGRGKTYTELPVVLSETFADYGYHFYDTSDLKTIGAKPAEMLDVEHTTEKGTLRLLAYLAKQEPPLARSVTSSLQTLLDRPGDVYVLNDVP